MSMNIADKPGCITKAEMRPLFEKSIQDTPAFRDSTPLGAVTVNGAFSHYVDPDTDTMWIGFCLGMRVAERLSR